MAQWQSIRWQKVRSHPVWRCWRGRRMHLTPIQWYCGQVGGRGRRLDGKNRFSGVSPNSWRWRNSCPRAERRCWRGRRTHLLRIKWYCRQVGGRGKGLDGKTRLGVVRPKSWRWWSSCWPPAKCHCWQGGSTHLLRIKRNCSQVSARLEGLAGEAAPLVKYPGSRVSSLIFQGEAWMPCCWWWASWMLMWLYRNWNSGRVIGSVTRQARRG